MPFVTKNIFLSERQKSLSFLMTELDISRSEAQRIITRGRISKDGIVIDDPYGYMEGHYDIVCFEPMSRGLFPIYEHKDFVIYEKPSGLRVHPYSRNSPYSLNDEIKYHYGNDANATHRIDQETSGLVMVSLNKESETVLKRLFSDRLISKRYYAMVKGHLDESLDIDAPLYREDHPNLLVSMVVKVDDKGKYARTLVKPIRYFPDLDTTLVEASPLTGRTHQIRVHLFHVKHPIIGDPVYGQSEEDVKRYIKKELTRDERFIKSKATRLLLHAHSLEFEYKETQYQIVSEKDFIAECLEAMQSKLSLLI